MRRTNFRTKKEKERPDQKRGTRGLGRGENDWVEKRRGEKNEQVGANSQVKAGTTTRKNSRGESRPIQLRKVQSTRSKERCQKTLERQTKSRELAERAKETRGLFKGSRLDLHDNKGQKKFIQKRE